MIIQELGLYNFGQYRGEHHLSLTPNIKDGKSITLIGGMNGGGKTTILDAVLLLMYGQRCPSFKESSLSYSNYLEACMHRNGNYLSDKCWVELRITTQFENKETLLKIRRSWERGNIRIREAMQVWKDGTFDSYLSLNWETYVEELLPYGIANLIFFDGEKIAKLASDTDNNETMMQSIQALLGLDIVDRLIVDMRKITTKQEKQIPDIEDNHELNIIKKEIQEKQLIIQTLRQELASKNTVLLQLNNDIQKKETDYIKLGGELSKTRTDLIHEKTSLELKISESKEKMNALAASSLPLTMVSHLLHDVLENMKTEKLSKESSTVLPVIKQHEKAVVEALISFNSSRDLQQRIITVLEDLRKPYEKQVTNEFLFPTSPKNIEIVERFLGNESQNLCNATEIQLQTLKLLQNQLKLTEEHLLYEVDESTTNQLFIEIKKLSQQSGQIDETIKSLDKNLVQNELELERLLVEYRKQLEVILNNKNKEQESRRVLEFAIKTQEKMEQFKKLLKLKKLGSLSTHITEAFLFLVHKTSLVSKVIINNETLEIKLLDTEGQDLPKSRLSAGEKQMLAISFLWGLAKASGRLLPIIIDTPMGRLDSSHRLNFVQKYLPNASHQVIILSTDTEIQGQYLTSIEQYINKCYMLNFDPVERETKITEGYFKGEARV